MKNELTKDDVKYLRDASHNVRHHMHLSKGLMDIADRLEKSLNSGKESDSQKCWKCKTTTGFLVYTDALKIPCPTCRYEAHQAAVELAEVLVKATGGQG